MTEFVELPHDEQVRAVIRALEEDGIFWVSWTGTPAKRLEKQVRAALPDAKLYMHSPPPDRDHVIIDPRRHPEWLEMVNAHAWSRYGMKERGVPDEDLPPLPRGVIPLEPWEWEEDED